MTAQAWRGRGARPFRFRLREPRFNWRIVLALSLNAAFVAACTKALFA